MAGLTYDIRSRMIEREKHFRLLPDALSWSTKGGAGRIAYAEVKRVNLMVGTSQYGMAANCSIWPRHGKRLVFGTVHFASPVSYENRAASYGPFVRELAARIAEAAPDAVFTRGSPLDAGMAKVAMGMLVAVAAVLLLVIGAFALTPEPVMLLVFAVIVVAMPATHALMKRYAPIPIDPRDLPDDLVGPRVNPVTERLATG